MTSIQPVACIIPAYQAASTLPAVLDGLATHLPAAKRIVVDDGSTDGIDRIEKNWHACIVHPANLGKGAALRSGFRAALEQGANSIITIDADGQHPPEFAPRLVSALQSADVVVGAREAGDSMPLHRRFTNRASVAAFERITGVSLPDIQSGFRAIRRAVIETIHPVGDRYEFETEFLILAARAGYRISSIRIPTIYGSDSHFRLVRDGARVVSTIWKHR